MVGLISNFMSHFKKRESPRFDPADRILDSAATSICAGQSPRPPRGPRASQFNAGVPRTPRKGRDTTEYEVGEELTGFITGVKEYGYFVKLPNGESGLIFHSDVAFPGQDTVVAIGDKVRVVVVAFKPGRGLALSIRKAAVSDLYAEFFNDHHVGEIITGTIKSVVDYGIFVRLAPGIDGLLHINNLQDLRVRDRSRINEPIKVRIMAMDRNTRRIALDTFRTK